jgi:hypothetical protein
MTIEEIKKCKEDLHKKIGDLLTGFEVDTGEQISSLRFVRRPLSFDLGGEHGFEYVVETKIEI